MIILKKVCFTLFSFDKAAVLGYSTEMNTLKLVYKIEFPKLNIIKFYHLVWWYDRFDIKMYYWNDIQVFLTLFFTSVFLFCLLQKCIREVNYFVIIIQLLWQDEYKNPYIYLLSNPSPKS